LINFVFYDDKVGTFFVVHMYTALYWLCL